MNISEVILQMEAFLAALKAEQALVCSGCGITSDKEPSVRQRCCRVACNDCHEKCLVSGRPMKPRNRF